MPNCPTCNHPVADMSIAQLLDGAAEWWDIENWLEGHRRIIPELGMYFEMVVPPSSPKYDSYGEGVSEHIYMILKSDDGTHYRKDGWRSYYGGTYWDGTLREVRPEPRTVTVYDYL